MYLDPTQHQITTYCFHKIIIFFYNNGESSLIFFRLLNILLVVQILVDKKNSNGIILVDVQKRHLPVDVGAGCIGVSEAFISCCWYIVPLHKFLCK